MLENCIYICKPILYVNTQFFLCLVAVKDHVSMSRITAPVSKCNKWLYPKCTIDGIPCGAISLRNLNNDNIFYEAREIPIESNFSQVGL